MLSEQVPHINIRKLMPTTATAAPEIQIPQDFSPVAHSAMLIAINLAKAAGQVEVGNTHVLLALFETRYNDQCLEVLSKFMRKDRVEISMFKRERRGRAPNPIRFSLPLQNAITIARENSVEGGSVVGTGPLLIGILTKRDQLVTLVLGDLQVAASDVTRAMKKRL